ncbi:hypothetical protein RHMOL_Rhmol08G0199400 [Rhododendron molle]|uniref:Uncharacterized protein n=1 Tax=Rhododendron molle TaxID=49168 RepID=A0ACC0MQF0_RHOML|nr:hypothetical protein RHMOL_Rhmol08G0199400 [Rhododendron molle]
MVVVNGVGGVMVVSVSFWWSIFATRGGCRKYVEGEAVVIGVGLAGGVVAVEGPFFSLSLQTGGTRHLDLVTFNIAIKCYCRANQVGFGFSLLGCLFKRGYMPGVRTFASLLNGLISQDKTAEAVELFEKIVGKEKSNPIRLCVDVF